MSARRSREREDKRKSDSRRSICGCLGCAPGVEYWYIRLVYRYTTHTYIYSIYRVTYIYSCLPGNVRSRRRIRSALAWPDFIVLNRKK